MLLQWSSSTRVPSNLGGVYRDTIPPAVRVPLPFERLKAHGIGSLPWIIFGWAAEFMLCDFLPSRLRRWRLLAYLRSAGMSAIVFVW
jgi:hypothetical protein